MICVIAFGLTESQDNFYLKTAVPPDPLILSHFFTLENLVLVYVFDQGVFEDLKYLPICMEL